jgi:hypothetical protein
MSRKQQVFNFSGFKNTFTHSIYPPIDCSQGATITVLSLSTFYTVKNITKQNNCLKIGENKFEIPEGNYNLTQLCEAISDLSHGDKLVLTPLYSMNRVRCESHEIVDFNVKNSINEMLGFNKKTYVAKQTHISEHEPKLYHIQSLCVHCEGAIGAFLNGEQTNEIHSANVLVPPSYRIVSEPHNLVQYKIRNAQLSELKFTICDENSQLISDDWGSKVNLSVLLTS